MKINCQIAVGQLLLLMLVVVSVPGSLVVYAALAVLLISVAWQLVSLLRQRKEIVRGGLLLHGSKFSETSRMYPLGHQVAEAFVGSEAQGSSGQERMHAILAAVKEGIVTLDGDGVIVSANPAALRLFEVASDALIGTRLWLWLVLDEVQEKLLSNGKPFDLGVEQLVEGVKFSGERFPLSINIENLDFDGLERSVVTLIDVSDLLGARDKLALNQAVKSSILSSALDAIITIDGFGNIVEFNPAAERTFGYARSAVLGEEMAGLIIPQAMREAHRHGIKHYLATGEHNVLGRRIEVTGLHRDGHEFPIELAVAPIHVDRRILFTAYVRDITERRLFEAELEREKDKAEAASIAKGEFLAVMSHELRTPLNAIIGSVSLLGEEELTEGQRRLLSNAAQAGRAMLSLVHDILDFSKIEVGKLELENCSLDLLEVTREAIFVLEGRAKDKSIDLAVVVDPNLPLKVVGDAGRIRQILINLIGNAIKFTDQGGVFVAIECGEVDGVLIVVEDTGIGIAEEVQDRLFSKFMQGDSTYSRKYGGTGLGLAICKRLAELMGGQVGVKSQLGKGSQFWVSLPLVPEGESTQGIPSGLPEHVWLTEPNPVTRLAIKKQLQYWNVLMSERESSAAGSFLRWKNVSGEWQEVLVGGDGSSLPKPILPKQLATTLLEQSTEMQGVVGQATQKLALKKSARVLVAEDSPANQLVAEMMLQRAGYEVACVSNGLEAVQAIVDGKFDLVLMDLSMPEMDGITATRILRSNGYGLPILAMTANVLKEDLDRCLAAGMDGYVTKPVVQAELLESLSRHLGSDQSSERRSEVEDAGSAELLWDDRILEQLHKSIGSAVPRMLDLYVKEAELRAANIDKAIAEEDFHSLRHESHALKSSSGTLGAVGMQRLAEQLERSCIECEGQVTLAIARKVTPLLERTLARRPTTMVSK